METNVFKELNGKKLKIAIIQARFNQKVTDGLTDGAVKALIEVGVSDHDIKIFQVPGSFEIPLMCQLLSKAKKFDGIIATGAVIKGETAHFEYVAKAVTDGILRVMLDHSVPIAFGVLAAHNSEQAENRARDDKKNKGYEAALALVEMITRSNSI